MTTRRVPFVLLAATAAGASLATTAPCQVQEGGSMPFLGIEILVDPGTMSLVMVPSSTSMPVPLPIPNVPTPRGLVVTAQGVHLDPSNNLAASRGLTFTVQ